MLRKLLKIIRVILLIDKLFKEVKKDGTAKERSSAEERKDSGT
jgi:hypothetical protein